MLAHRISRRTAWLAVFAVLLNTFAPLISHANASKSSGTWIEVCTAGGVEHVDVADGPGNAQDTPATGGSGAHCPYCLPHGASFGLPPATPLSVPVVAAAHAAQSPGDSTCRLLLLWAAHQPRAPPLAR
jgi:hypothetical protein